MGRYITVIVISVIITLAVELGSCSSGDGDEIYEYDMNNSDGGHPFGVDITDDVEVYPYYDEDADALGFGFEIRPNDNVQVNVEAGVDINGNPVGEIGFEIKFRRRRSTGIAFLDEETSRKLFSVIDWNEDGKIDVVDWSTEGGKIASFSDLIVAHDMDGDEKLSLDEFLVIPILPDRGLGLVLGWGDEGDEGVAVGTRFTQL